MLEELEVDPILEKKGLIEGLIFRAPRIKRTTKGSSAQQTPVKAETANSWTLTVL